MSPILTGTPYGSKTAELEEVLGLLDASKIVQPIGRLDSQLTARLLADHIAALREDGVQIGDIRYGVVHRTGWEDLSERWPAGAEWRRVVAEAGQRLALAHRVEATLSLPAPPVWPSPAINVFGVTVLATDEAWRLCKQGCTIVEETRACWEALCFAEGLLDDLLVATFFDDTIRDRIIRPLICLLKVGVIPIGWVAESFECFRFGGADTTSQQAERVYLPVA
ncbi:MAG: hypothetical protein ABI488_17790 [Polyangiaceae bacterium]